METRILGHAPSKEVLLAPFWIDQHSGFKDTIEYIAFREIEIHAPAKSVYPWLLQFRCAPYSYDLLDNRGQSSPQFLISNLPSLNDHRTILKDYEIIHTELNNCMAVQVHTPVPTLIYQFWRQSYIEYRLLEGPRSTRLVVKHRLFAHDTWLGRSASIAVEALDRVMMGKQLRNIRHLSEKLAMGEIPTRKVEILDTSSHKILFREIEKQPMSENGKNPTP